MALIERKDVILKEYGRNVQNMAAYLQTISQHEKRTLYAKALIDVMKQINPSVNSIRDVQDMDQKLWDDLHIMSEFKLDVDSPYPKPDKTLLYKKPRKITYNTNRLQYRNYGRNVEMLIEKVIQMKKPEDQEAGIIYIGRLMKSLYMSWSKESIDDQVIAEHIERISKGKIKVDIKKIKEENLFSALYTATVDTSNNNKYQKKNNHHRHHHKKRKH